MNSTTPVLLKKFDPEVLCGRPVVVVIIGRRETGKSFLSRDLLLKTHKLQSSLVSAIVAPTEDDRALYVACDIAGVSPDVVHQEYSPSILQTVVEDRRTTDTGRTVVLDNCMYTDTWCLDQSARALFLDKRELGLSTIFTMPYPLGLPQLLRAAIDYVFVLKERNVGTRKRLFDHYGSAFDSFDVFCQLMDQCTQNYECLVIAMGRDGEFESRVFWYKAETSTPVATSL
jgi:hypothetical protein